jgi:hypothetical protein
LTWKQIIIAGRLIGESRGLIKTEDVPDDTEDALAKARAMGVVEE